MPYMRKTHPSHSRREYADKEQQTSTHLTRQQSSVLPNSAMLSLLRLDRNENDLSDSLEQHFLKRQVASAEAEAERLSSGISGRNEADIKFALGRKLGADFSGVQFHTDAKSAAKADAIGAAAFTRGNDVFFGSEGFKPETAAHELVHTVQQGSVDASATVGSVSAGQVQMLPKLFKKRRHKLLGDNNPIPAGQQMAMQPMDDQAFAGLQNPIEGGMDGAPEIDYARSNQPVSYPSSMGGQKKRSFLDRILHRNTHIAGDNNPIPMGQQMAMQPMDDHAFANLQNPIEGRMDGSPEIDYALSNQPVSYPNSMGGAPAGNHKRIHIAGDNNPIPMGQQMAMLPMDDQAFADLQSPIEGRMDGSPEIDYALSNQPVSYPNNMGGAPAGNHKRIHIAGDNNPIPMGQQMAMIPMDDQAFADLQNPIEGRMDGAPEIDYALSNQPVSYPNSMGGAKKSGWWSRFKKKLGFK